MEKILSPLRKFLPLIPILFAALLLASCAKPGLEGMAVADPSDAGKDGYKFGFVLPMTGASSFYGQFAKAGIDLAVEDVNKAGGINGKNLTAVYEDTRGDKSQAANACMKLADADRVDALFTQLVTGAGVIAPIGESARIPTVYHAFVLSFAVNKTFVFQETADVSVICDVLTRQAIKDGHKRIALFGTNNEFTQVCKVAAEKVVPLAEYETYESGESDYRAQFTKIAASKSTALIIAAFSTECDNAFKQMRELDLGAQVYIPFYAFGCGSSQQVAKNPDLLEDAYGSDVGVDMGSWDPVFQGFKARLDPGVADINLRGTAIWYDSVMMMAKAYEGCKDTLCVANNLRAINFTGVSGQASYGGDQFVDRDVLLAKFKDGKWERVEDE